VTAESFGSRVVGGSDHTNQGLLTATVSGVRRHARISALRVSVVWWQRAQHGAVFAFFLAIAAWWLRPLTWRLGSHVTSTGDPLITAWRLVWPVQWLLERPAPFLDSNVLYPASAAFARDELMLGQTLFAGPVYALTRNALLAHNVTILLTVALSGFTTYWVVWRLLHHRAAALIAGIIMAIAPYHLAQIDHAGLLAVQWLPLVLYFLDRTLRYRRGRDALLLGLFAFLQSIAAGYYAYVTAFLILAYLGYCCVLERRLLTARGLLHMGAALGIAMALLVPIILPFWRVASVEGFARSPATVEVWSAKPRMWAAATPDNLLYGQFSRRYSLTWHNEVFLFPGLIALALGGFALRRRRARFRAAALALALVGFILSLGPVLDFKRVGGGRMPLPYAALYRFVPGMDALRAPLRIAPLTMLGIALLAAIGWKRLEIGMRRRHWSRAATYGVTLAVIAGMLGEYATAPITTVAVPQLDSAFTPITQWLAAQPPGIVLMLPNPRAAVAMTLATATRHRFVNGEEEVRPPARRALFQRLSAFPDRQSITALEMLGVDLVILDRTGYTAEAWRALPDQIRPFAPDLTLAAPLPNALVYHIAPAEQRFPALLAAIPPAAHLFISATVHGDEEMLDRALLAHLLAREGRDVRGPLDTNWITDPPPAPATMRYDFGIFARDEPPPDTYDRAAPIWSDATCAIYRARSA
jgi:hypothetical protein